MLHHEWLPSMSLCWEWEWLASFHAACVMWTQNIEPVMKHAVQVAVPSHGRDLQCELRLEKEHYTIIFQPRTIDLLFKEMRMQEQQPTNSTRSCSQTQTKSTPTTVTLLLFFFSFLTFMFWLPENSSVGEIAFLRMCLLMEKTFWALEN